MCEVITTLSVTRNIFSLILCWCVAFWYNMVKYYMVMSVNIYFCLLMKLWLFLCTRLYRY